jgi:uncharacterized protein YecT (DUF1311 family)
MPSFRASHEFNVSRALVVVALFLIAVGGLLPEAAGNQMMDLRANGPLSPVSGATAQSEGPQSQESQPQEPQAPVSKYDKAIFQKPIPAGQLVSLNHFAGTPANDVIRDKQFRKFLHSVLPDRTFHYGWDMSPFDAFDRVLTGSQQPVQIRDGRYLLVSTKIGPYLKGRGFIWIDMQDGIALGAFYFHPTNGEPTPTVTVFSRQIKEESLRISQLPPAFAEALSVWSVESDVPAVTTRYFIGDSNKKILLEHDEDYCATGSAATAADDCEQMNADAADIDLNAAYYLDQTNHATNATAWMIVGEDQVAWVQLRDNSCRIGPDRLRCRIRMTRERTQVILGQHPAPHPPHK